MISDKVANSPQLSVVVPIYEGEECLLELYSRLTKTLNSITVAYEIILVEDCGKDNSWALIHDLAAKDQKIKGIKFSRNFGQHYGITAGLDLSSGNWVVVMDCDLQDSPEDIVSLYAKALEGYDVVWGIRNNRQDNLMRIILSKIFYAILTYLSDIKYDETHSNFCIMSRKVVFNYCLIREQLRFFAGIIKWMGFREAGVAVGHAHRFNGKSSYSFTKLWKLSTEAIIAYSDKPLRLSVKLGFLMALTSFSYGSYILFYAIIYGVAIPGWSSLFVALFFLGGTIIAILGIIGVYLGKTFDETKKKPLYIISEATFEVKDN